MRKAGCFDAGGRSFSFKTFEKFELLFANVKVSACLMQRAPRSWADLAGERPLGARAIQDPASHWSCKDSDR